MTSAEVPRSPAGPGIAPALLAALAVILAVPGCRQPSAEASIALEGRTMGTTWHLRVAGDDVPGASAIRSAVQAELDAVEAAMSTWRDDSEVSRFNRSTSTDWIPVSPGVASVVGEALEISHRSDGAFDITVGPLVRRWGFGPREAGAAGEADGPAGIGFRHLEVRHEPAALRKDLPIVEIDLSAIAKGHAVDAVAGRLVELGIERFMVEVGGEVRTRGARPGGGPWRIGIELPDPTRRAIDSAIPLRDLSMATSGDYRNFRDTGEGRFAHVIDPRSGRPVTHDLAGVTVVAENCRTADAWATALLVLGMESGYVVAEREGLAALFIRRTDEGFPKVATPAFRNLRTDPESPPGP